MADRSNPLDPQVVLTRLLPRRPLAQSGTQVRTALEDGGAVLQLPPDHSPLAPADEG